MEEDEVAYHTNNQHFHRRAKIKFAMELKRKRSASSLYSSSSNVTNPKRKATPAEDSPLGQLFNDVGIQALVGEVKRYGKLVRDGKKFLISLQGLMNNSSEESANHIYVKARHIWEYELRLTSSCAYAIYKERSLSDKLAFYSNHDAPVQRMASMMKDPWLEYILGDRVLGLKKSDAFIRGFLSILIAYWNMKDIFDKYELGKYGRTRTFAYIPINEAHYEWVNYVIDHVEDFQNLREVLESKYGSDPDLVASLFKQISNFQVNEMYLGNLLTSGKRIKIKAMLRKEESNPLTFTEVYVYAALP